MEHEQSDAGQPKHPHEREESADSQQGATGDEQGYEGAGVQEGGGYQRSPEGGGGYERSGKRDEDYDPREEGGTSSSNEGDGS